MKAEYQHMMGLLQLLTILERKWDMISIDFITRFPMSSWRHNCIMVTVEKLSKVAQFSPMKASYIASSIVHVFLEDIVWLHGIPRQIILDRDPKFTLALWTSLEYVLGP